MTTAPANSSSGARDRRSVRLGWIAGLIGLVLAAIGVRFLLVPEAAARFFGVGATPSQGVLSVIVALRDLWLGLLAVGLAWLGEWRALALWLGLGALVCVADAALVAATSGRPLALAFHLGSGLVCGVLARLVYLHGVRSSAAK
jgi:hypothetical protein